MLRPSTEGHIILCGEVRVQAQRPNFSSCIPQCWAVQQETQLFGLLKSRRCSQSPHTHPWLQEGNMSDLSPFFLPKPIFRPKGTLPRHCEFFFPQSAWILSLNYIVASNNDSTILGNHKSDRVSQVLSLFHEGPSQKSTRIWFVFRRPWLFRVKTEV